MTRSLKYGGTVKHTMLVRTNQHSNLGQTMTFRGVLERGIASALVRQGGVVTQVEGWSGLIRRHLRRRQV